jgi:signal transduction histidine kinase
MTLVPRSLFGRLFMSAGLFITIALVVAGLSIGQVLERFVMHGLDDRLDTQITLLARAVRADGTIDGKRVIDVPPFDEPDSGWIWQIVAPHQTLRSASTGGAAVPVPVVHPPFLDPHGRHRLQPADGVSAEGEGLHFRTLEVESAAGPLTITAAGPREVAERPLRQAIAPLALSLLILGIVLIAAIMLQLRFGLRPLRRLETSLIAVRNGGARHVSDEQPYELRSLVAQLNGLIDENEAGLENARRHVANLAHGLKTPLAALRIKINEAGHDPDGEIGELITRIDASIRHHLGRARAAAPGGLARKATPLAPHVHDLVATLGKIHAERPIAVSVKVDGSLAVGCDPQDLDEMLGNLLDNARRWATSAISVTARINGPGVDLIISDDGPGLTESERGDALVAGRRLDERADGYGFGLSIAQELAELYGGSLTLGQSPLGGLSASLSLPLTDGAK